jgi:predicted GH43/DUF377 family glycosyl hydrolase
MIITSVVRIHNRWNCALSFVWIVSVSLIAHAEPPADLARWLGPQTWQRDVDGPIVSLGQPGDFDDQHIFAPAAAFENGRYWLWYSGSRGTPGNRVFRLGLATSDDGKRFDKHAANPVLAFADNAHSVLTPALLRNPDGSVLRENGKLRLFFSATRLGKSGLHTLHQSHSSDGIAWNEPSPPLLENCYCPTVLKTDRGYEMWYSDVSRRPWVIRHAASSDGNSWQVTERPVLVLSQSWEAEVFVYPTVLKIDGAYLMWYGSYDNAIRRETTAIGFAASSDGKRWHKHPKNPVFRPDQNRPWESNYVGSGSVLRLPDGSFRYYYASRKAPPFNNLYFAINTARWDGPPAPISAHEIPRGYTEFLERSIALQRSSGDRTRLAPLPLPPSKDDHGVFIPAGPRLNKSVDCLEIIDDDEAIVRAWYFPPGTDASTATEDDATFVDLWLEGIDASRLTANMPTELKQVFRVTGTKLFDTTCGRRSLPLLVPIDLERYRRPIK